MDTQDGVLRYVMVLKCCSCHEISFAKFVIGKETELKAIESSSNANPIDFQLSVPSPNFRKTAPLHQTLDQSMRFWES